MSAKNPTKEELIRRTIKEYPIGGKFTASEISETMASRYKRIGFSSMTVGSIITKKCGDLVSIEKHKQKDVYIYTRRADQ